MSRLAVGTQSSLAGDLLPWDTKFWGTRMGHASGPDVDQWAVDNMIGCVSLLVGADRPDEAQRAEERGYRFTDVRVALERPTAPYAATVHRHHESDVDRLAEVARASHRITRFYADPRFADERCDDLYEAWIRNSCGGWADVVLVADDAAGYATVHLTDETASIGLIAVDENARCHGIGHRLVEGAIDWAHAHGAARITVVTQGRNVQAQRVFQKCGFVTASTAIWMHKWYLEPSDG